MSKKFHFVEGFVAGVIVSAAAAWFFCSECSKKKCDVEDVVSNTRTGDLIKQTRDAIDKGFDKLSKMAETRHSNDTEK